MNRLWKLWVTLTLLYLLLSRGHGGPGIVHTIVSVYRGTVDFGNMAESAWAAHPQDIMITPCNRDGSCRDE